MAHAAISKATVKMNAAWRERIEASSWSGCERAL
jgi:hypothetical protein